MLSVAPGQILVFGDDATPQSGHVLICGALSQIAVSLCLDEQEVGCTPRRITSTQVEVTRDHLSDDTREFLPGPVEAPGTLWSLLWSSWANQAPPATISARTKTNTKAVLFIIP